LVALIASTAFHRLPDTDGRDYVRRCLRAHQPFGVITGANPARNALVLHIAVDCAAHENLHTIRIARPTHSAQVFLSTCLEQLGFELSDATLDNLHDVMVVFLRHESARGRRTVVIVENADHCGLPVFSMMRALSQVRAGTTPAGTFILTGTPDLHRILDSPDLARLRRFTRQRFDLDGGLTSTIPARNDKVTHQQSSENS